jgi:hypothetical protein
MSDYPGQDPTPAAPSGDGAEPDGPGYWERKAAEEQAQQPGQQPSQPTSPYGEQPTFNPTSGYGAPQPPPPPPAGSQPSYYGYPQQTPGYPASPGQPAYGYAQQLPDHPRASVSLALGIIGLAGGFVTCGVGFLVSPFAWVISQRTLRQIRESHGQLGGEGQARAGQITGIIGSILLVLAVIALVGLVAVIVTTATSSSGSTTSF